MNRFVLCLVGSLFVGACAGQRPAVENMSKTATVRTVEMPFSPDDPMLGLGHFKFITAEYFVYFEYPVMNSNEVAESTELNTIVDATTLNPTRDNSQRLAAVRLLPGEKLPFTVIGLKYGNQILKTGVVVRLPRGTYAYGKRCYQEFAAIIAYCMGAAECQIMEHALAACRWAEGIMASKDSLWQRHEIGQNHPTDTYYYQVDRPSEEAEDMVRTLDRALATPPTIPAGEHAEACGEIHPCNPSSDPTKLPPIEAPLETER